MSRISWYARFARSASRFAGRPRVFLWSLIGVLAWLASGPLFHYSNTWQLVINTATTIVTFLMVFLIQNTQNRDTEAMQIKLDELIRATNGAHNALLALEELEDTVIERFRRRYAELADDARRQMQQGALDTGTPETR